MFIMKKILLFLMMASFVSAMSQDFTRTDTLRAYEADVAPTIDGVGDELIWTKLDWNDMKYLWMENDAVTTSLNPTRANSDLTAKFKITWNQQTKKVYLLVEVTDEYFDKGYSGTNHGSYDFIEIFLDENGPCRGAYPACDHTFNDKAYAFHCPVKSDNTMAAVDIFCADNKMCWTTVDHTSNIAGKVTSLGNNKYLWEISFNVINDNRAATNIAVGKVLGFTLNYADSDSPSKGREDFVSNLYLPANSNTRQYAVDSWATANDDRNASWVDSDLYGILKLEKAKGTGSKEVKSEGLSYFPNPIEDVLNIESTETITSVKVMNLIGNVLISKRLNESNTQINLSQLPQGIYILEICQGDKCIVRKIRKN